MLAALGLSADEARCYETLLDRPHLTAAALARRVSLRPGAARRCLDALVAIGLASHQPDGYAATRPDVAIELLVLRRREELERVRASADDYLRRFRSALPSGERALPVDVITGPNDAIVRRWEEVQRSAVREVLICDRPPYVRTPDTANPVELELLRSGIAYRVLYDETSLTVRGRLDAVRTCVEAGEQARVLAGVPMKLIVADRTVALTHDVHGSRIHDSVLIHPSGLLDGLAALFEHLWQRAAPFPPARSAPLDDRELEILALLLAGSKDETVARQLDLGLRTVRRHIARLMDVLGARTRMQAGAEAVRRGLV